MQFLGFSGRITINSFDLAINELSGIKHEINNIGYFKPDT